RMIAQALGTDGEAPVAGRERLAGAEPEFADRFGGALTWTDANGVSIDLNQIGRVVDTVREHAGGDITRGGGHNVRIDYARRALAASVRAQVAKVLHGAALNVCRLNGVDSLALGGSMFGHAQLNTELDRLLTGGVSVAFVPESAGRSLGAALASSPTDDRMKDGSRHVGRLPGVAVGPSFSDGEIKRTLDNC